MNWIKNQVENLHEMVQNSAKGYSLGVQITPTLVSIISGTKCDQDQPFISAEKGSFRSS